MYKILKTILSDTIPQNTDVLWLKPMGKGFAFYLYNNGKWDPMQIVNTKNTVSTDDDTVVDVSNIPSLDSLNDKIANEVTTQMQEHDLSVGDTHHTETSDENEYPDVSDFFSN